MLACEQMNVTLTQEIATLKQSQPNQSFGGFGLSGPGQQGQGFGMQGQGQGAGQPAGGAGTSPTVAIGLRDLVWD
jgi:hypothetical protein